MKQHALLAGLLISMAMTGLSNAATDIFYKVPFQNVEIKAASKIYADYNFNSHTQYVACKMEGNDDSAITSVEWLYKDASRKIDLPVVLKDNDKVKEGYFADPEGRMIITNEFGSMNGSGSIFVSCEYRKI